MRVLGVDPGLTRCGLGVVDGAPGRALTMVRTGVARTSPDAGIGDRLLAIEQQIEEWLVACRPDAVAVERVFSQHNVSTVMGTAQAGAVAIVCAARHGIPVALHTPSEVKAAVTGNGRADKAQVTAMVTRLLRLTDPPHPADAADALALAICHIWRGGAQARLAAAQAQAQSRATQARAAQVRAAQAQAGSAQAVQARAEQVRAAQAQARAGTEQAAMRPAGWGQAGGPR
jgi:crossover junction endodeoxyribonuclease RuvC